MCICLTGSKKQQQKPIELQRKRDVSVLGAFNIPLWVIDPPGRKLVRT